MGSCLEEHTLAFTTFFRYDTWDAADTQAVFRMGKPSSSSTNLRLDGLRNDSQQRCAEVVGLKSRKYPRLHHNQWTSI